MKQQKIGLIHATVNSVEPIMKSFQKHAPEAEVLHFLDEGLLEEVNKNGGVTAKILRRFTDLFDKAEDSGVDGILAVCSVFTSYLPDIIPLCSVPVLSADFTMLEEAAKQGERVGLISTVPTAAETSEKLLAGIADEQQKRITVQKEIVPEAFEALKSGNPERHDQLIQEKIESLTPYSDVIVLTQISMARAKETMTAHPVPVLTSSEISVKSITNTLSQRRE